MEEVPSDVEVVIKNVNNKGIIIRDREEITDKGEEIKTTEYFLDVGEQGDGDEVDDTQFVTVQSEQDGHFVAVEVGDSGQLIIPDKEVILWNEICRVCANSGSDKEFIPIFSGEGLEHDLSSKIHTYLPMRVSENDTLPLQVCYNCAATMIAWDEIFKGCMDAQQRLLELQSKLNLKEQYYNDSPVEEENMGTVLEVETTNHEEPQVAAKDSLETLQIVEPNRSRSSQTPKTDTSHKLKNHLDEKKSFKFSNSNESGCLSVVTLTQNLEKEHFNGPVEKGDSLVSGTVDAVAKETRIMTRVLNPPEIRTSRETDEISDLTKNRKLSEEEITTATANVADLLEHEESEKVEDETRMKIAEFSSSADECLDRSSESSDVDAPEKASSETDKKVKSQKRMPVSYTCDDCGKIFKFKDTFSRHRRIHSDERPFTCHVCGKRFRDSGGLCRHVRDVHAKVKKWPCSRCSRSFASKATRDDHERTHTGERPYICDSCGKSFKTKASLYIHAKIHTDLFPHLCVHCDKSFRRRQELLAHVTTHTGEKNFECDVCFKSFRIKMELRRHALSHSDDKPFVCELCDFRCKQRRYLNNHVKHKHSLIEKTPYEGASTQASSNVQRKTCTKEKQEKLLPSFRPAKQCTKLLEAVDPLKIDKPPDTDDLAKQIQETVERFTYMCGVCDELFDEEDALMRHIRKAHEESDSEFNPMRYECSICGRSYETKIGLIRHLAKHRGTTHLPGEEKLLAESKIRLAHVSGSVYKCNICMKVLSCPKSFLRHIRVHNNEKPIVCDKCGKSYRMEQDLKRHQDDVHEKIKRFPCDLCEMSFAAKGTRDAHRRIHTGEKPFECNECGKFFRSVSLLGVHKRMHQDYRPHKCNSCEKAFRSKQKLEAHEAIHTGIRPYPCDICKKLFAAKGEVTRHRSVHFNEKRFLCSECGLAFRLNRYLKTHIRMHHEDKAEILLKSLTE